jgi:hypothetical protein
MPDAAPALDPLHAIHLENGHFSDQTETHAGDIDRMLDACFASPPTAGLAIHFHGGLVSLKSGKGIAHDLGAKYQEAGAYPVFFVWESGPVETIVNNWGDIAREPVFRELVRKGVEFALGKLGDAIGAKGTAPAPVDPARVAADLDAWYAGTDAIPPYAGHEIRPAAAGARAAAQPDYMYQMEIQANLEADPRFTTAVTEVANGLLAPAERESSKGGGTRAATSTLMDPAALVDVADQPEPGQKGLITMAKLAVRVAKVVYRVTTRCLAGRDHGLYGTVVEEVLRGFYGDKLGQAVFWNQMKKDTEDAFDPAPAPAGREAGGLALLQGLKTRLEAGHPAPRITLIGHSTGAIYICRFIERADQLLPAGVRFDIVLLAPAVDFKLFARTMADYPERVGGVRLFGMQDTVELADAMAQGGLNPTLARILYPHSLLYFVSGLLEGAEVDLPILGMARFFDRADLFTAPAYPEVDWTRAFLAQPPLRRTVWSVVAEGPGCNSSSRLHGDFDNDPPTVASVQHLLRHGYSA